jgi:hypothetical protein
MAYNSKTRAGSINNWYSNWVGSQNEIEEADYHPAKTNTEVWRED